MAKEARESSSKSMIKEQPPIWTSPWFLTVVLILLGLAALIGLSFALNDTTAKWLVLGSALAFMFTAAGAFFGAAMYRERAVEAERRALAAEDLAVQYREDATRGRALAAVLQNENPASYHRPEYSTGEAPIATELLLRYRGFSFKLFGDLISPGTDEASPGPE